MSRTPYCAFRAYRRIERSMDRLVQIKQFCSKRIVDSPPLSEHIKFWNGAYCAAQEDINDIIDARAQS